MSARFWLAVVFFAAVGAAGGLETVKTMDATLTDGLQRLAPSLAVPARFLVVLGNAEVVIPAVALAGLLVARRGHGRGLQLLTLAGGLALASVLAVTLKLTIPHLGPSLRHSHHLRLLSLQTPFSFPSGHTARATIVAGVFLRRAPLFSVALVLAMMVSLVYVGDHWPSDVVGGFLLGWACWELTWIIRAAIVSRTRQSS